MAGRERSERPKAGDTSIAGKALAPKRRGALQAPHRSRPSSGGLTAERAGRFAALGDEFGSRSVGHVTDHRQERIAAESSHRRRSAGCPCWCAAPCEAGAVVQRMHASKETGGAASGSALEAGQAASKAAISTAADWRATVAAGGVGAS